MSERERAGEERKSITSMILTLYKSPGNEWGHARENMRNMGTEREERERGGVREEERGRE